MSKNVPIFHCQKGDVHIFVGTTKDPQSWTGITHTQIKGVRIITSKDPQPWTGKYHSFTSFKTHATTAVTFLFF